MKKYLLYWSAREILANPSTLSDELSKGENGHYLAGALPKLCSPATALERARRKRPAKGFMYRSVGRCSDGNTHVAFTEETTDPNAVEVADKWKGDAIFTASSTKDGKIKFSHVPPMFHGEAEKLERAYSKELGFLTQPDIGNLFTKMILNRWKGIRVKAGSAVFIVPGEQRTIDEIQWINASLKASGVECRFVKTEAGDTEEQREEIRLGLLEEIEHLKKHASKMLDEAKSGKEIRFQTLQKRMKEATESMTKAQLFGDLLENKMGEIKTAVDQYKDSIMEVMNELAS